MGKARQLAGNFARAEPPASGRQENLFLREKGTGGGDWQGRGGKVSENFAGHDVSSPPDLSTLQ